MHTLGAFCATKSCTNCTFCAKMSMFLLINFKCGHTMAGVTNYLLTFAADFSKSIV